MTERTCKTCQSDKEQCLDCNYPDWPNWTGKSRIDIIGQNGNDGLHYTTAQQLLKDAATIMDQRAKQYDAPGGERSMGKTVAMFNLATGRDMTEVEGWFFMECLKNVRYFQNPKVPHEDSVKDKIAYAALFGEAALCNVE